MSIMSSIRYAQKLTEKHLYDIVQKDFDGSWSKAALHFEALPQDFDLCTFKVNESCLTLLDKIVDHCRKTGRIQDELKKTKKKGFAL